MFATPFPSPSPSASFLLQKPQTPLSLVSIRPTSHRCLRLTSFPIKSSNISQPGYREQGEDEEEEEEPVVGDCLVFEQGIFEDPFPVDNNQRAIGDKEADVSPQNLIPENWIEAQRELNIPKKERRKLAREMEYGRKMEKRRQALMPIADYEQYKRDKLKQLKPIVLDKPLPQLKSTVEKAKEEVTERDGDGSVKGRVESRNPRLAVYGKGGGGLEDISVFFNSGRYDPASANDDKAKGTRKLFTKEEKALLNRRVPDLAVATSVKWHPLHTLAASGEFYLVNSLLKHGLDINAPDKDGLTAIHKAILGKKQAVFNFLLRESANPFIRDEDGATLMHYAVFAASTEMIKILLLYNVNINLQDNDGWTPLHLAVQSRRTDIVRLLLIKGADKTIKNRDGLTPLDLCLYSGKETRTYELIKLIKRFP